MLIFKQFVSAEIPEKWESNPVKFRRALELIKHVRETYIIPNREVLGSGALPVRPKNTPAPIDTSLRKQATICCYCDEADFKHGDHGIVEVLPDGFTKEVCFRSRHDFKVARNYVKYQTVSESRTRLPYGRQIIGPSIEQFAYPLNSKFADYNFNTEVADGAYDDWFIAQDPATGSLHAVTVPELVQDFDGNDDWLTERDANEASMYESESDEQAKLDRWRDTTYDYTVAKQTFICTPTREQMESDRMGEATEVVFTQQTLKGKRSYSIAPSYDVAADRSRTVFVEGDGGFHSIELLNLGVTERYHNHLLNVFRKDDTLRVGSVAMGFDEKHNVIHGTCVRNDCKGQRWVRNDETLTVEDKEAFIYSMIAHGNNHAASWLTERGHAKGCYPKRRRCPELGCDPTHYVMPDNLGKPVLTKDEEVMFLMEHNSLCKDSGCSCSERLAELVPALKAVA